MHSCIQKMKLDPKPVLLEPIYKVKLFKREENKGQSKKYFTSSDVP